jgi:hypothetical protein
MGLHMMIIVQKNTQDTRCVGFKPDHSRTTSQVDRREAIGFDKREAHFHNRKDGAVFGVNDDENEEEEKEDEDVLESRFCIGSQGPAGDDAKAKAEGARDHEMKRTTRSRRLDEDDAKDYDLHEVATAGLGRGAYDAPGWRINVLKSR